MTIDFDYPFFVFFMKENYVTITKLYGLSKNLVKPWAQQFIQYNTI